MQKTMWGSLGRALLFTAVLWCLSAPIQAQTPLEVNKKLDQIFVALAQEYAARFVGSLFRKTRQYDFEISLPHNRGKSRLELVLQFGLRLEDQIFKAMKKEVILVGGVAREDNAIRPWPITVPHDEIDIATPPSPDILKKPGEYSRLVALSLTKTARLDILGLTEPDDVVGSGLVDAFGSLQMIKNLLQGKR